MNLKTQGPLRLEAPVSHWCGDRRRAHCADKAESSGASTLDHAHSAPAASPRFAIFCVRLLCPRAPRLSTISRREHRGGSAHITIRTTGVAMLDVTASRCRLRPPEHVPSRSAPLLSLQTEHPFYSLMSATLEIATGAPHGTVDPGSRAPANAVARKSCRGATFRPERTARTQPRAAGAPTGIPAVHRSPCDGADRPAPRSPRPRPRR